MFECVCVEDCTDGSVQEPQFHVRRVRMRVRSRMSGVCRNIVTVSLARLIGYRCSI
jgi:hypothetical protein